MRPPLTCGLFLFNLFTRLPETQIRTDRSVVFLLEARIPLCPGTIDPSLPPKRTTAISEEARPWPFQAGAARVAPGERTSRPPQSEAMCPARFPSHVHRAVQPVGHPFKAPYRSLFKGVPKSSSLASTVRSKNDGCSILFVCFDEET
jgi:hypothetical protein